MSDAEKLRGTYYCERCGQDLTPTPAQIEALQRWGNPLRREPCLETRDGLHIVSKAQLDSVAAVRKLRALLDY